jgi:hypothetical protein
MNGAINYTLGLTTSPFLGGLRGALTGLAGLAGTALSLGAVMRGVWGAISEGGKLQDLSARTGESVASLYSLRAAFADVGASAENLPILLLNLQRALGGADESGKGTAKTFSSLGLDPEKLKGMDAAAQIEKIVGAMSKMDKTEASSIGSKIFGRGFGDINAIMADFEGFQRVLHDTAEEAQFVARSASAFDRLGDTFATLKRRAGLIFTGIAESLAPTIQSVADMINGLNFADIGQKFGGVISGIIGAIQAGRFGELISLSIQAGIETGLSAFAVFAQTAAQMLVTALSSPAIGKAIAAGLASAGSAALNVAGEIGSFATAGVRFLGETRRDNAGNRVSPGYADILVEEQAKVAANTGERTAAISGYASDIGKELQALAENLGTQAGAGLAKLPATLTTTASAALAKIIEELQWKFAPAGGQVPRVESPKIAPPQPKTGDVDALTKIGGFSGQGSGVDYARQTARNTASQLDIQRGIFDIIRNRKPGAGTTVPAHI